MKYSKGDIMSASKPTKLIPKKVTCPRCNGDGIWHSPKTGVRAKTSSEPLVDSSMVCPDCQGSKKVTTMITEEQAKAEAEVAKKVKAAANAAKKAAKAQKEADIATGINVK